MTSLVSFASQLTWSPGQSLSVSFHTWKGTTIIQPNAVRELTIFYPANKSATGLIVTDLYGHSVTPAYVNESYKNDSSTQMRMMLVGLSTAMGVQVSLTLIDRVSNVSYLQLTDGSALTLMTGLTLDLQI
ncbi:hypothetical protein RsoM2USA_409 [Ralstonia phage RsoM2USA]|nr:hypothetical protein RsoM2USA_409 [Ralstonia phage RsoM2USA]